MIEYESEVLFTNDFRPGSKSLIKFDLIFLVSKRTDGFLQ